MPNQISDFIRIWNVAGEGHCHGVPILSNLRSLEEEEEKYGQTIGDQSMEEGSGLF